MSKWTAKDVLRADQFTKEEIATILELAGEYERALSDGRTLDVMKGLVLSTLFFEPSTRTRLSFETAMLRLGGGVVSVSEAKSTSASKGESLHDTIRTVEGYADVIVLRHPQIGAADEAARATDKPVLNAGDGAGQHPTQSLLDLYTITKETGRIDTLTVALAGDLKNGRTVHSLALLLANYEVQFVFIAPPALRMPDAICNELDQRGVRIQQTDDLATGIEQADVLYMTRIQRERFDDPSAYDRLKDSYVLTRDLVESAKDGIVVMHPLPRVNEIATDVDDYGKAAYFRQAANGVPVRMALLALVSGRA